CIKCKLFQVAGHQHSFCQIQLQDGCWLASRDTSECLKCCVNQGTHFEGPH
ncbi:hypothetical protein PAXRUDRAFT_660142, partial [Paxillus rubicundulus Ve08.2h10]